eukprot:TRINITY_DN4320_c0_g1_i1.p2 TRINITY_DN4320_c0_g1~~TRINITY_DN4320_c0_g1_i1.p2  ORF type:complete len:617 (-),score=154.77 TRINITY_DN4320_c0_g1_i1:2346-4091(-)
MYQLRWFVRDGSELKYYAAREDKVPRGTVNLYEASRVAPVKSSLKQSASGRSGSDMETNREFIIQYGGDKVVTLRAKTSEIRDAWVEALMVWAPVTNATDAVSIPRRIYTGVLGCIDFCISNGVDREGLFRIPGSSAAVHEIAVNLHYHGRQYFDNNMKPKEFDVYDVGSALKKVLRELPEPILTFARYDRFRSASKSDELRALVEDLPERNRNILRKLFKLCITLCNHKETQMHSGALSICLAPCLGTPADIGFVNMNSLFEKMITEYDKVFGLDKFDIPTREHALSVKSHVSEVSRSDLIHMDHKDASFARSGSVREIKEHGAEDDEEFDIDDQEFEDASGDVGRSQADLEHLVAAASESEGKDNDELASMTTSFRELVRSKRIRADNFRSLVTDVLKSVSDAVTIDGNATLNSSALHAVLDKSSLPPIKVTRTGSTTGAALASPTTPARGNAGVSPSGRKPPPPPPPHPIHSNSVTPNASADVEKLTEDLRVERKKSALLAARIVDLEQALLKAQRKTGTFSAQQTELKQHTARMDELMFQVFNTMRESVMPVVEELRREQILQKKLLQMEDMSQYAE